MSATILHLFSRKPTEPNREQQARDRVTEEIRAFVSPTILAQAKARAARNVVGGIRLDEAVRRACVWAVSADHGPEVA